jgi:hypothetical protein
MRAFQTWPAWKKGAFAALVIFLIGPVTRGELHGSPGLLILALGFVIWSAKKARAPLRLRVASSPRELREAREGEAAKRSDHRAPEPPGRDARQRRRHR